jgi:hypothetical protein
MNYQYSASSAAAASRCFNCAEKGHRSRECPRPQSTMCYNCQEDGHISQACPIGKYCHSCGDPNHLISVCPVRGPVCYRCGIKGHFAKNCYSPAQSFSNNIPTPYSSSSSEVSRLPYNELLSLISLLHDQSGQSGDNSLRCCLCCVTCTHDSQHCCKQIGGF